MSTARRGPSLIRSAHGKAAECGALLVVETPVLSELRPVDVEQTSRGHAEIASRGRPFQRGNRAASNRKPGLAALGLPIKSSDPRYKRAYKLADAYVSHRTRELAAQCGGRLGAGPSACLASAGLALAASRVMHELASETLDPKLFTTAARLGDAARQAELTAVALAEREAASMRSTRKDLDFSDEVDDGA